MAAHIRALFDLVKPPSGGPAPRRITEEAGAVWGWLQQAGPLLGVVYDAEGSGPMFAPLPRGAFPTLVLHVAGLFLRHATSSTECPVCDEVDQRRLRLTLSTTEVEIRSHCPIFRDEPGTEPKIGPTRRHLRAAHAVLRAGGLNLEILPRGEGIRVWTT